ncbi:hypothetical protein [Methanosarcina mazei]|jgi:hypothetical protein|uniref:Uncharacterized protein n=1 Tax=Methanosarcina mazei TaxID=2209 RepID=A0A0F8T108_METMZ|nr:hypothetical protein [Methanosarcina mazei]KKG05959.1 hypothetical protein DU40_07715 [Methanosarcina mazei]KKG08688.1 hypothetical protein DU31_16775 [Methanosarcina mazei]KKG10416.1 hypothetical protein DU34_08265 [Methanosarcina mazei]KKG28953.1 hypothetical protein DU49_06085 [Methanosarcina mazei]KKG29926.1 hypothetical protein DU52_06425 [Methanosarcina mazei]
MTKRQFAVVCSFLFIIAHMFRRWKQMQKSHIWKGFLSESMWVEGYGDLSHLRKLLFWLNYPFSYARYSYDVVWDRVDRLGNVYSRTSSTEISIEFQRI